MNELIENIGGERSPFIVRIAGLPASVMESFRDEVAAELFSRSHAIGEALREAREHLATRLFDLLRDAPPDLRGLLLEVKRDCHNGRRLSRRQSDSRWPALLALGTPLFNEVVALEESLERTEHGLEEAYEATLQKEREALAHFANDTYLLRGLTLSSPSLAANLPRFDAKRTDKRQARLEAALLRFVSRAALKTSPFSTLTRLGLGVATPLRDEIDGNAPSALRLVGTPWEEHSLVRSKCYVLEQDYAILSRYAPFRNRLRVTLNGAMYQPSKGQFCIIRPGSWAPRDGEMWYTQATSVQANLSGSLIEWLLSELGQRAEKLATFGNLCARAEAAFPPSDGASGIRNTLEKLVEIGFLLLIAPWPTNTADPKVRMLEELRELPSDPLLAGCSDALERLLVVSRGYPSCAHPLGATQELERLVDVLWDNTRQTLPEPAIARRKLPVGAFFEEVYLVGPRHADNAGNVGTEDSYRPIVELSGRAAADLVEAGRALARWSDLFGHQPDFLRSLAAFANKEWKGQPEVPFVELANKVKPLWQAYGRFTTELRTLSGASRRAACFNPFDLESLRLHSQFREDFLLDIGRRVRHIDDEAHLSVNDLSAALSAIPSSANCSPDACLFVQPADAAGNRWMLNRLYEGTGRYGSRYTPVMPEQVRRKYTSHLAARADVDELDGQNELADIVYTAGDTLNVHATQTRTVLELFDESVDAPHARKLSLGDLRVSFADSSKMPRIIDREGRTLAPVHLGVAAQIYMPFLVQLLIQFGPQPLSLPRWGRSVLDRGAIKVWPRFVVGPLVVSRQAFTFPASVLPAEIRGASKKDAFLALNHWRLNHGIPARVFLIEQVRDKVMKPQFIDFTSPHFATIFMTSLTPDSDVDIMLEEMLPTPDVAPIDATGRRCVVELQLDTLAFRTTSAPYTSEME